MSSQRALRVLCRHRPAGTSTFSARSLRRLTTTTPPSQSRGNNAPPHLQPEAIAQNLKEAASSSSTASATSSSATTQQKYDRLQSLVQQYQQHVEQNAKYGLQRQRHFVADPSTQSQSQPHRSYHTTRTHSQLADVDKHDAARKSKQVAVEKSPGASASVCSAAVNKHHSGYTAEELKYMNPDARANAQASSSSASSSGPPPPKRPSDPSQQEVPRNARFASKRSGPITWKSVAVLLVAGTIGIALYQYEKDKKLHSTVGSATTGTPLLGGPFTLTDKNHKQVSSSDLHGQYILLYFGFTHCPDICPAELEKMQVAVQQYKQMITKSHPQLKDKLQQLFISIDPKRDTPERLQVYSKDWSPDIQWLTGSDEQIRDVAKKFRVYYSAPEWSEGSDDQYLVDHSIFFYLLDRDGDFMQYFSRNMSAEDVALKMYQLIKEDN